MKTSKFFINILVLCFVFVCFLSVVSANSICIDSTNGTLESTVNNYDTIYLNEGIYNGSVNRGIIVNKNTTIVGNDKNSVILNPEKVTNIFNISKGVKLTLKNITLINNYNTGFIINHGSLEIQSIIVKNASPKSFSDSQFRLFMSQGDLKVNDSIFNNNYGSNIISSGDNLNIEIINSIFKNNHLDYTPEIIYLWGNNQNIKLDNLTFINATARNNIIYGFLNNSLVNITNSKFINSSCLPINIETKYLLPTPPSLDVILGISNNVTLKNNTELNTVLGSSPSLILYVDSESYSFNGEYYYIKPNTIKITVQTISPSVPGKKIYLYINNKLVSTKNTNSNGDAIFYYSPKTPGKFNIKTVFKGYTKKVYNLDGSLKSTSTVTGSSKKTSFTTYGDNIWYSQKSKFVYKNKYLVRTYMVKNIGKFVGSTTIRAILAKKYNIVYISKNIKISYNKKNRVINANVKNLIPYAANKKSYCLVAIARKL